MEKHINWEKINGLLPVIVQDATSGTVLMLGYMNREALAKTQNEGRVTYYSRSKQRLWTKGETSGHYLNVRAMSLDCDNDTLLILAEPQGPTCHTGAVSCFHAYDREPPPGWPWFAQLADELAVRKNADPATSYTARLHARGLTKIAQKVGEEGVETALAAVAGDDDELSGEIADLLYHLTVLLHARRLDWPAVLARLHERHRGIGLHPEGANKP